MNNQNMSDLIEAYLKTILQEEEVVEIRRVEMASQFSCVPSQINYVIKTRFTLAQGYMVESKRGGGGYIRIQRVQLGHNEDYLCYISDLIEERLTYSEANAVIEQLFQQNLLTKSETQLLLSIISYEVIGKHNEQEDYIRSNIIKAVIDRLRYEEKG
ncbi:CtsR family transcriptional regulator [Vagococcus xieshaowenii]|uniref:Transcriptional regulator CtsR n=1 Tax=Vagococcus xieshaowenii TaxID=2562451 RepID=A0A4Z0D1Y0_9ENTE|nr:CtsR family transcriptional regulator [Vagococcus xieshaowenii]QCA29389.1 CtsR family transcriptional regulator [Vagococcus xieshaowenii]TFZ39318.1 CtsR family transcriptional regulator [Vagococcus xieshaowenii]